MLGTFLILAFNIVVATIVRMLENSHRIAKNISAARSHGGAVTPVKQKDMAERSTDMLKRVAETNGEDGVAAKGSAQANTDSRVAGVKEHLGCQRIEPISSSE